MSEILPEDAEEGARQSAFRAGYRTGFGDGFEAADKVHEAAAPNKDAKDDKGDAAPGGDPADAKDKKADDGRPPLWKRPLFALVAIVVAIAIVVVGTIFFIDSRRHETTDDAFVDG